MRRPLLLGLFLLVWSINRPMYSQEQKKTASGHYLFAWTGDAANKRAGCSANCGAEGREGWGNDFLAVIDADPVSRSYGHLVTTVATDQQTMYVHHTEYTMPANGMLFANDHDAGRTFIFDVRDPLHPTDGRHRNLSEYRFCLDRRQTFPYGLQKGSPSTDSERA